MLSHIFDLNNEVSKSKIFIINPFSATILFFLIEVLHLFTQDILFLVLQIIEQDLDVLSFLELKIYKIFILI